VGQPILAAAGFQPARSSPKIRGGPKSRLYSLGGPFAVYPDKGEILVSVRGPGALEQALPDIMKESPEALFVESGGWFEDNPQQTVDFALKSRLPALYGRREYAETGGFMSCGIDYREMYRTAADYISRILKGAQPAVLPVQQPTKIQLVINMKTAKALGLTIPPALLLRANQIFE